jgi:hypothetical protein
MIRRAQWFLISFPMAVVVQTVLKERTSCKTDPAAEDEEKTKVNDCIAQRATSSKSREQLAAQGGSGFCYTRRRGVRSSRRCGSGLVASEQGDQMRLLHGSVRLRAEALLRRWSRGSGTGGGRKGAIMLRQACHDGGWGGHASRKGRGTLCAGPGRAGVRCPLAAVGPRSPG